MNWAEMSDGEEGEADENDDKAQDGDEGKVVR